MLKFTNTIPYSQQIHLRVESNETTASSNWHHYAMVFGSDENYTYENIKFYIDGQEVLVDVVIIGLTASPMFSPMITF